MARRVFILVLIVAPYTAVSQSDLESAAARQRQIVESIQQEESQNGPLAEGLIGPLTALALLHEEEGDQLQAQATIERALEVIRVNYGLHSLEQAPLIRQLINYEESRGNAARAWDLEQELLTLARRHPSDLRTVPILRAAAEKRKDVRNQYLEGEFPPEIRLGCYYDWPRIRRGAEPFGPGMASCDSGSRDDLLGALFFDIQGHIAGAIAVLLRHEGNLSQVWRDLETELIRNSLDGYDPYFGHLGRIRPQDIQHQLEPWRSGFLALTQIQNWDPADPDSQAALEQIPAGERIDTVITPYGMGRSALRRLYAQELATGTWQSQVNALVQIADWDLLHRRNTIALSRYEFVLEKLDAMGVPQASIDEIFSPNTPVVLPTFLPNPLESPRTPRFDAYIDVAFAITGTGWFRKIEILDTTTPNVTDAARDSVVDVIQRSRFRPRVTNGQFARRSPVVFRYYLNE